MGKAATQRDVHDPGVGPGLQQLAPRAFEAEILEHGAWRLADKGEELPLQRPAGNAGDGRQFGQPPIAPDIAAHRIQCTPDTARQHCR